MANIGKTSSSKYIKSRNYSDRSRFVSDTASVKKVTSIQSANNDHLRSSTNQLMNFDQFYELLQTMKQEYRDYFQHKRDYDDNLKAFKKQRRRIMVLMENLLRAYNLVMESLIAFDKTYSTHYQKIIENLIIEKKDLLKEASIDVYGDHTLMLNRATFNTNFANDLSNLEPLVQVEKGFFDRVFKVLYSVKIKKAFSMNDIDENTLSGKILDLKG